MPTCLAILGITVGGAFLQPAGVAAQEVQRGAQARREIHGTVTDSASKEPVPGVTVVIPDLKLGALTDSSGRYRISGYLPATVTVMARSPGFAPVSRRVNLSRGSAEEDFVLARRATLLQGITVRGETRADTAARFLALEQASSIISPVEIQQTRGVSVGETIKELPGVSVIQYGPSIAKPVVRGLHSQRVATINNGVPQEGQQWGGEHAPEIDAFAANEIEVIRGPGTILYGSGALAGVVRVTPRALPTQGAYSGEFTTNTFSNNRQGAASLLFEGADLNAPVLGRLGWRVQGSARRAGDAATPDYYLPNTGFKELDYNAALGMTRPWGRSELDFSHYGTLLGLYVGAHVGNLDDLNRAMEDPYTTSGFSYDLARPDQKVRHDMVAWHTELRLRTRRASRPRTGSSTTTGRNSTITDSRSGPGRRSRSSSTPTRWTYSTITRRRPTSRGPLVRVACARGTCPRGARS